MDRNKEMNVYQMLGSLRGSGDSRIEVEVENIRYIVVGDE